MREVTTGMREKGIKNMELVDREECRKKNGVCLWPHGRSKNIWRNVRTNSTLSLIKFFKSPSNHNLSPISQA